MDSACALVTFGQGIAPVSRVLGVSRAQLTLRMKASDNKTDKRRQRRDEAADAEVLSRILDIIGDMPTYGYRRVWAIPRRQSRNEGLPFVNAKRVYRIMSENSLLLLHDKPSRPQREHKGRISVRKATSVDVLMALSSVAMMAKKSGLRSLWTVAIVKLSTGQPVREVTINRQCRM